MLGRFIRALELRLETRRALREARAQSEAALARGGIRRVLVLCHGNIYRSPFVARMLEAQCPKLEVRSAGFHHRPGRASPDSHIRMSDALGVSLQSHRSALVSVEDAAWADLIVLMDRHNWARLRRLGVSGEKVLWLGALEGDAVEIDDPYGQPEAVVQGILARLQNSTRLLIGHLSAKP